MFSHFNIAGKLVLLFHRSASLISALFIKTFFYPKAPLLFRPRLPLSSIVNVPGESTLRRDFIRLQQENKERSEALRRQQLLQEQQLREQEEYKRQLLAERQKRIEQQKEQRRRLEEVGTQDKMNFIELLLLHFNSPGCETFVEILTCFT